MCWIITTTLGVGKPRTSDAPAYVLARADKVIKVKTASSQWSVVGAASGRWSAMWSCFALGALLFALRVSAHAQQPGNVPRIGFLSQALPAGPNIEAFRQGMREHGYVDGKNIIIEYRNADGKPDRLPSLASDLVSLKVNGIIVAGSEAALAAKNATTVIPIIMVGASDPVGMGLVASLARPGGNVTGSSSFGPESSGKRLELLKEVVPSLSRVAAVVYSANPAYKLQLKEVESAARALKLQLQVLEVREPTDFDGAFGAAKKGRAEAVNILTSAFLTAHRKKLVDSAEKSRLPVIYPNAPFVEAGGLMSYGPSLADNYRRAAVYVDKILKGSKPADLPVEQPTRFEFFINLKTGEADRPDDSTQCAGESGQGHQVKQGPSQEFILSTAEGFRTSLERKDMPAATYVNNQFILGGEKGFRSHGQPQDRP